VSTYPAVPFGKDSEVKGFVSFHTSYGAGFQGDPVLKKQVYGFYVSEREREHKQGERQKERDKQTPRRAGSPMLGLHAGLDPRTLES